MRITQENAIKLIKSTAGRIFTVTFVKKDGSLREMNCRLGVTKYLKGGELAFDVDVYDLMPVFDVKKKAYRMIQLNSIKTVSIDNKKYKVS